MFDSNPSYLELHAQMRQTERDLAVSRPLSQRHDEERIVHDRPLPAYRRMLSFAFDAYTDVAIRS